MKPQLKLLCLGVACIFLSSGAFAFTPLQSVLIGQLTKAAKQNVPAEDQYLTFVTSWLNTPQYTDQYITYQSTTDGVQCTYDCSLSELFNSQMDTHAIGSFSQSAPFPQTILNICTLNAGCGQ